MAPKNERRGTENDIWTHRHTNKEELPWNKQRNCLRTDSRKTTGAFNQFHSCDFYTSNPVSILQKSIAGRYRPARVADGPITTCCRFIKNASWEITNILQTFYTSNPVSSLQKSIAGRYRPVRVADGPITTCCRFIKNASWEITNILQTFYTSNPLSILQKSIAGRYRLVRVADGPITTWCRFIKNARWEITNICSVHIRSSTWSVSLFVWFGLNVAFNNLSVISRRCLDVAGSSLLECCLTEISCSRHFDMIFHPVALYWHWVDQF